MLKESLNSGSDPVEIKGWEFCSHSIKADKAWDTVLDHKYRVLFGIWEDGVWEDGVWEQTEITEATRLDCAFVDFINNRWCLGKQINEKLFQDFITHFEEKLKNI